MEKAVNIRIAMILLTCFMLCSCGGGSGGTATNSVANEATPPTVSVTGTWKIHFPIKYPYDTVPGNYYPLLLNITQTDSTVSGTFYNPDTGTVSGTVSGNILTATLTPDNNTYKPFTIKVTVSGSSPKFDTSTAISNDMASASPYYGSTPYYGDVNSNTEYWSHKLSNITWSLTRVGTNQFMVHINNSVATDKLALYKYYAGSYYLMQQGTVKDGAIFNIENYTTNIVLYISTLGYLTLLSL